MTIRECRNVMDLVDIVKHGRLQATIDAIKAGNAGGTGWVAAAGGTATGGSEGIAGALLGVDVMLRATPASQSKLFDSLHGSFVLEK